MNIFVEDIYDKFNHITKKPEKFLSTPETLIDDIKLRLKETYDFIKHDEATKISDTLPTLIINHFDVEQIWQQIELQNNHVLTEYLSSIGRLVVNKDKLWFVNEDNNENISEENKVDTDESSTSENELIERDNPTQNVQNSTHDIKSDAVHDLSKQPKKSLVDDDFFKLDEMEKFLKHEEQHSSKLSKEESDDEKSVDLFDIKSDAEIEEDEESAENNPKYDEFFCDNETENQKRKRSSCESSDDSEMETEQINFKSSFELKNERLHKRIEDIEEQALKDKSWQYKGEITADKRPQNSLLEEIVDFDMTTRPAPVITEETTYKLEDLIKKRIKDKVWDDVERKTKLVDTVFEYKKKLILNQEKNKQSLSQIYEDEYLKQKQALNPDTFEKLDEDPINHTEIKSKMKNLFAKLDALSNFHFTPKSVAPELHIVNNLPAINMEEVAPVATSEAALLAPEEIKKKAKGHILGKAERTKTDKNRERRQKKIKQKEHAKEIKNKEKTSKNKSELNNKHSKHKALNLLNKMTKDSNVNKMNESENSFNAKSSISFFTKLQDEVQGQIKKKTSQNSKTKQTFIAKKLKL